MNREKYESLDGINFSKLKFYHQSPAHYQYFKDVEFVKTRPMQLGLAAHLAILQPAQFERMYYVIDEQKRPVKDQDFRNSINRQWKAKEELEASKYRMESILSSDYEVVIGMKNSVFQNKQARKIISESIIEKEIFWKDNLGINCKGIPDMDWESKLMAVDLKTSDCVHPEIFRNTIADKLYHCQGAFYNRGLSHVKGKVYDGGFTIIAVENKPPYICEVYFLSDSLISLGSLMVESWLSTHIKCTKSGLYPSYSEYYQNTNGVIPIDIPNYIYSSMESRYSNIN